MIYAKNNNEKSPVLDGNTFSVCCKCGKEVPVPLNELFKAKKDHPLSARIMCPECTKERFRHYHPTLNDVAALTLTLCKLGYTRQVRATYDDYDIEDIQDLHPNAYGNFVSGLLTAVAASSIRYFTEEIKEAIYESESKNCSM